jgi:hypothetical protein
MTLEIETGAFEFDAARVKWCALAGLNLALVLLAQVDALHHHAPLVGQNVDDFTTLAFIFRRPLITSTVSPF